MTLHTAARASGLITLALLCLTLPAAAQDLMVDRGTFLLSREGRAVGTEEFIIRRTGTGPEARIIATADIRIHADSGVRNVSSALELSASGLDVQAYQVKASGDSQTELYMTLSGGRFQAKIMTGRGEQLREFRARTGTILLDQGVVHHYHFLAARALDGGGEFAALVPRAGGQVRVATTNEGGERIQVAGRSVEARHLRIELDGDTRDLWLDERGRVLRLVDPASGFRAERKNLPD